MTVAVGDSVGISVGVPVGVDVSIGVGDGSGVRRGRDVGVLVADSPTTVSTGVQVAVGDCAALGVHVGDGVQGDVVGDSLEVGRVPPAPPLAGVGEPVVGTSCAG